MTEDVDAAVVSALYRRRLRLWRGASVAAFSVALLVAGVSVHRHASPLGPHLARLKVHGTIGSDVSLMTRALKTAEKDSSIKGLLLDIDSPGGAVTGGEALHDAVERFAKMKPVVVTMGGMGASAGYMIAVPAKRIFAQRGTLTGSIGVLMQSPDVSSLLDKVGVSVDELVSGPLKGQPSMVKPLSPEGRTMLQGVVNNLFEQFVTMVATGRHMPEEKVKALADGRPYTGQQALALGLIDSLGDEDDAKASLAKLCALPEDAKIETIGEKSKQFSLRHRLLGMIGGSFATLFGFGAEELLQNETLGIDGPVAIWKP
ncbi:signal peptide peptidase SppA [Acetobacter sacchari]|uniref:Signal peptide peptidase SppA n=1 Tax=Acetobacter sacchari TaxID=2661687 RepID=A0ABS3LRD3_9PROT|nr:signal peptide peptidase SppA [Acetobacter sacchari]MBO1358460.1 signal peptide peptidase SppA [Acetobacter sacchari]